MPWCTNKELTASHRSLVPLFSNLSPLVSNSSSSSLRFANEDDILSSCVRFFIRNKTVKIYLHNTLVHHRPQTHELFLDTLQPFQIPPAVNGENTAIPTN